MRARPLERRPVPLLNACPTGAHELSLPLFTLANAKCTRTHAQYVQPAAECKYKCGWVGRLCNGVPYGTLYFMAACPKIGASALPALPAVTKQEGETRACVIATGLWVPLRFHSVAPKVPFAFVCSTWLCPLGFVPKPLGKWASLRFAGNYSSQGCRSLLVSCGMPRVSSPGVRLSVCPSVCVRRRGEEMVGRASRSAIDA